MKAYTLVSTLLTLLPAFALADSYKSFDGQGHILVLQSDDRTKASIESNQVGCLDVYGQFTASADECGIFTHNDAINAKGFDGYLSTKAGNCTWWNSNKPQNTDSYYGWSDKAFECSADAQVGVPMDYTYTLKGLKLPYLCTGDRNCAFDAQSIPVPNKTTLTWVFRWGSQQDTVPKGHAQVLWVWDPVKDTPESQ